MNLYLLFKSLHLISVISWMAGLLYLPESLFIMLNITLKKRLQKYLRQWKENYFFIL